MRIKPGFVLKEIAGNNIIVNQNGTVDFNGMITLNETGAFLWRELERGSDSQTLTETLKSEYDVDTVTAKKDVILFINKLKGADVIE